MRFDQYITEIMNRKQLKFIADKVAGQDIIETPDFTIGIYTGKKHKGNKIYREDHGAKNYWMVDKNGVIYLVDKKFNVIM